MKKEWKPVNAAKRNSIKSVDRTENSGTPYIRLPCSYNPNWRSELVTSPCGASGNDRAAGRGWRSAINLGGGRGCGQTQCRMTVVSSTNL